MRHVAKKSIWIQKFLNKLLLKQVVKMMKMLDDNETSLILTKDLDSRNCIQHINVIYHHIQGLVKDGKLGTEWISSSFMLAYGLK